MKYLFLLLLTFSAWFTQAQPVNVVISQVYGGGGSATGTYNADYVELHNTGNTDQDISGCRILYGSATGSALATVSTNGFTFAASGVVIPAGGYLLVATLPGAGLANLPVVADDTFTLTLAQASGKVVFGTSALINNTALSAQPAGSVIDFVGYGSANESETSPTGILSATTAALRNGNGCDDTDNNFADFSVGTPNPRNSLSPVNICGVTPAPPTLSLASALPAFGNICINTTAGPSSFGLSGVNLTAADITVGPLSGYTFATSSAGPYSATLTIAQGGGAFSATVFVQFLPTVVQFYGGNIPVSGGGASAINVAASGSGVDATLLSTGGASSVGTAGATLNGSLNTGCDPLVSYGFEYSLTSGFTPGTGTQVAATNLAGTAYSVILSGLNQGTAYYFIAYAVTGGGIIYGAESSFTTGIVSTGGAGVVISQVYGGGGGATGTFNADYVELHNNTLVSQNISGCKIMYGSSTGNLGSSSTNIFTFPAGSVIAAGGYLLVATSAGTGLADLPVTPDHTFTLTLSGTNGKILFGSSSLLANTTLSGQPAAEVFDFVGYGTANESETAPVSALSSTTAAFRNNNGCDDTNNNLSDFSILTPDPRNSLTPPVVCSAVPVTLVRFEAVRSGKKVQVQWTTSMEENVRQFVVERSRDGQSWQLVETRIPAGNSSSIRQYSLLDPLPFSGISYYRLRIEDRSGHAEYSRLSRVSMDASADIALSPNPASETVVISFTERTGAGTQILLLDAGGRVVRSEQPGAVLNHRMRLAGIPRGSYVLRLNTGKEVISRKLLIQ